MTINKKGWLYQHFFYSSVRFSMALSKVTSSAYSMSEPTASPRARRVTLIPAGLRTREIYIEVASPSAVALVDDLVNLAIHKTGNQTF